MAAMHILIEIGKKSTMFLIF